MMPSISWSPYPSPTDFSSINCEGKNLLDDSANDVTDIGFAIITCKSVKVSFFRYYLTDHTETDVQMDYFAQEDAYLVKGWFRTYLDTEFTTTQI